MPSYKLIKNMNIGDVDDCEKALLNLGVGTICKQNLDDVLIMAHTIRVDTLFLKPLSFTPKPGNVLTQEFDKKTESNKCCLMSSSLPRQWSQGRARYLPSNDLVGRDSCHGLEDSFFHRTNRIDGP